MDTETTESRPSDLSVVLSEVDRYAQGLDAEAARYWTLHRARFCWIGGFAMSVAGEGRAFSMLDVGNSFQTLVLRELLPYSRLDTIGYLDHRFPAGAHSKHIEMDLNDAYFPDLWPEGDPDGYDLIVFSEVIEHLYTAPEQVLSFFTTLLKPGGRILIQTPNAAALKKRLKLLLGKNPYELIRPDRGNPGHFRELTVRDLRRYAKLVGLSVEKVWMDSNLVDGKRFDRICDRVSRYLPGGLRGGISISLQLL